MTFPFQDNSDNSDADSEHTLSYELESAAPAESPVPERVQSRGNKGRSRSRGRGRSRRAAGRSIDRGASRGRSARRGRSGSRGGVRGRRVQRGQIRLEEGDEERIRRLQEERTAKANDMIDRLSEDGAKQILKAVAEKVPSVVLDVAEMISAAARQAPDPEEPGPSQAGWPSCCVCQRCREMPSDASRVCCGMRPDLCTTLMPA